MLRSDRDRVVVRFVGLRSLLLLASLAGPAEGQAPRPGTVALVGGRLVDGTGAAAVENAVVILRGDRIAAAGAADRISVPTDATVVRVEGKTIMPGLIESNGHVIFSGQSYHSTYWAQRIDQYYEIGARNLATNLMQGVTTIRDTMDPLDELLRLRAASASGLIAGSRLFLCGTILNYPGAYYMFGDATRTEDPETQGLPPDRVERARDALVLPVRDAAHGRELVRKYAAQGVDFIKVSAHRPSSPPPTLSTDALREIVAEAHQNRLRVTTHTESDDGVRSVIDAGVDAMEHPIFTGGAPGDTLTDELVRRIVERKIYSVPLIVAIEVYLRYLAHPSLLDDAFYVRNAGADMVAEGRRWVGFEREANPNAGSAWDGLYRNERLNLKKLIAAGAPIAMGTDKGTRLNYHESANHVRELEIYVELGMTPMDALVSATRRGAEILGQQAELGTIEPGKLADVIVVDGNPLERISALRNVVMVYKGGVRYK